MPTKRMFDMVLVTIILIQPVKGLIKMVVARRVADANSGPIAKVASGATNIFI